MTFLIRYLPALVHNRVSLALAAAILYFFPPFILSIGALWMNDPVAAWSIFSLGIGLAACGVLMLLTIWRYREAYLMRQLAPLYSAAEQQAEAEEGTTSEHVQLEQTDKILLFQQHLEEYQQEQVRCTRELDLKNEAVGKLSQELEQYRHQFENERKQHHSQHQIQLEQIEQQKGLLDEYQMQIAQQRQELACREQTVIDLENKVRDLTFALHDQKYELQTLLQMNELPADLNLPPILEETTTRLSPLAENRHEEWIRSSGEALLLLKRCLEAARKITAPSYYTPMHAPFGHTTPTSHPLDLRRLCDNLGSEKGAAIMLYAPKEDKILCATFPIIHLTGWSSEAWIAEGVSLMGSAAMEWKNAASKLAVRGEILLTLTLPHREGAARHCHAYLGSIPSGLFRHYLICVLFPVYAAEIVSIYNNQRVNAQP